MRRTLEIALFLLLVGIAVAALYNVMGDHDAVQRTAQDVACEDAGATCNARLTFFERNPIAQTYEFATVKRSSPARVRCTRDYVFVGPYACVLQGGPLGGPTSPPAGASARPAASAAPLASGRARPPAPSSSAAP